MWREAEQNLELSTVCGFISPLAEIYNTAVR